MKLWLSLSRFSLQFMDTPIHIFHSNLKQWKFDLILNGHSEKKNVSFRTDSFKVLCQISHLLEAQPSSSSSFKIRLRCYVLWEDFFFSSGQVRFFLLQFSQNPILLTTGTYTSSFAITPCNIMFSPSIYCLSQPQCTMSRKTKKRFAVPSCIPVLP